MASFKTSNGETWILEIKTKHAMLVKNYVRDKDGNPIDLLELADSGLLFKVLSSLETLLNVAFCCCLDEIKTRFSVENYDRENEGLYELFPEMKNETAFQKSQRWFAGLMNGEALVSVTNAMKEAVLDFCPSQPQKDAYRKVFQSTKRLDEAKAKKTEELVEYEETLSMANINKTPAELLEELRDSGKPSGNTPQS